MDNRPRHPASPGSSGLPQEDTTELINEPTENNESTSTNHPVAGPSQSSTSYPTLDILQAHLAAEADSDSDEDAGPRVHPDFFVHLERLRSVNEANRVNARRVAEARFQAHQAQLALNQSQHESPQFANAPNQPWYDFDEEDLLQTSPMGSSEQHGTQAPAAAGSFVPSWQAAYETSDPVPAYPRDRSSEHRAPSPSPVAAPRRAPRRAAAGPSPLGNPPMTAEPERRYTDHGNPYTFARDPPLISDDVVPLSPERMLQAWLIRAQLIAGVRPEDLQPMSRPSGMRHRTPPWIVFNDSGAHIIRIEPARFNGVMLPMPDLPWFPRRADPNSSTAPVSSNAPAALGLSTASNNSIDPSSTSTPNQPTGPTSTDNSTLPDAPDMEPAPSSVSIPNPQVLQDVPATPNPPVASNLLPVQPIDPTQLIVLTSSDDETTSDDETLPDASDMAAAPSSVSISNAPVFRDVLVTPRPPVALGRLTIPTSLDDETLPDTPDIITSVSSLTLNSPQDLTVPQNSPVDSNQSDDIDPRVDRFVQGAAASLATLDAQFQPAARRHFDDLDPIAPLDSLTMPAPGGIDVSNPTSVPEQSLGGPSQHVANIQDPDPRVVAFLQPLRLHEPANSSSSSMLDTRPEGPSTTEPASNESSQIPAVALQSQSQTRVPLTVQNRTDADSISSREAPRVGASPAPSQDQVSSSSNEHTETGHVSAPEAAHGTANGNGVVHHDILWSQPDGPDEEDEEDDLYGPSWPRLRRFPLDGADDSLGAGRLSGESKAPSDQSSFGGLI
ncbi:uncharacterized protein PGRI_056000 [Penicillium griseofulvum]|uniref:Uncharacterized protein n=1 Tax=Penicillium patulum TaxID=5078 RepID=A0A135LKY4_PENPA|nr:uncharacterized protein PGRI_056000 [Penicillium griseofulvum]KXG49632.1 hypothetical protein PGRI_056000 [Penicillium griseofulvum]